MVLVSCLLDLQEDPPPPPPPRPALSLSSATHPAQHDLTGAWLFVPSVGSTGPANLQRHSSLLDRQSDSAREICVARALVHIWDRVTGQHAKVGNVCSAQTSIETSRLLLRRICATCSDGPQTRKLMRGPLR